MTHMRIGHGYDVHRFDEDRPLILGGVEIPSFAGLKGHSDADVLTHAIMDALLGAAGLRDIGYYFPPSDDKYKGAKSTDLAKQVAGLLSDSGYTIVNIDSTLIAEAPKMSPHIAAMRVSLAEALGVDVSSVNVKATTEEGLGFTGERLGIAAHAVCLLKSI